MRFLQNFLGKSKRPKIFCIGQNKTGTTSLARALGDLGYAVGNQARAELLLKDYAQRNFEPIVNYCHSAEAFQDIPFSLPHTYIVLDYAFPGSKFILSIRDSEDEWYESLIRFHQRRLGVKGRISWQDLDNDGYRYKGFISEAAEIIYNTPEDNPYDEVTLKAHYRRHNSDVVEYFRFRKDLLIINLKEPDSYQKFCDFLAREPIYEQFPWLNKSSR